MPVASVGPEILWLAEFSEPTLKLEVLPMLTILAVPPPSFGLSRNSAMAVAVG